MITRRFGFVVGRISLREVSGSSATCTPAAASSGSVSSKIRPFDNASVSGALASTDDEVCGTELIARSRCP